MIEIKKLDKSEHDFNTDIFSIEINGFKITGTNTNNHQWCFRKDMYNFDSDQEFDLYQVVKDVNIDRLPNRIQFTFYQSLIDKIFYPIDRLPYPLDTFIFIKENDKLTVGMSCYPQIDTWKRKWATSFYFEELEKIINNIPDFIVVKSQDLNVFDEMFEFIIETEISQISTISEAFEKTLPKFENLIELVERNLSDVAGLLKTIDSWKVNQNNDDEEFWQNFFVKHSHIISQAFSVPSFVFNEKAYLGGKGIENTGGKVIDFVYKNAKTNNIYLIEIKTPKTKIIGSKYRGAYSISAELSGAINQMLQYKDQQQKEFYTICGMSKNKYELFNPKCLLIAGSLNTLLEDEKHVFELFRNDLKSIDILTFDELFGKIELVLALIRENID